MDRWQQVLVQVAEKVPSQNFEIYFRPTSLHRIDEVQGQMWVNVPNRLFKYWLEQNYRETLDEALAEAGLAQLRVCFVAPDEPVQSAADTRPEQSRSAELPSPCSPVGQMNPKYTFDTFVVGRSNQFAHAAALSVAERPACAYNPLFIHGGVGLGKTHLMHAIGQTILATRPHLKVVYMSAEEFINELIPSIRFDRMLRFREKYRKIDVLMMDDIQFFAGKGASQEEFFHTFNALYDSQKQIIISSDSPPRKIPTLEERLHSRFEWGLIADIEPPELETKVAILRKKAEAQGVAVPDDVAVFIAANVRSDMRELEGSLIRLMAYSSLTGERMDYPLAQRVLRNLTEGAVRPITVEQIQRRVADHFSLKISELKARNNSRRIAEPRQMAMFLSKELTHNSLSEIGREFGGKHHTTVLHAIRKIEEAAKQDHKVRVTIEQLKESIL